MSSSNVGSNRFSACDQIAAFYKALNVPTKEFVGPLGGKSFFWFVNENGEEKIVRCFCTVSSFGFGKIRIETPTSAPHHFSKMFIGSPAVDSKTAKVVTQTPVTETEHVIQLPVPDASRKV